MPSSPRKRTVIAHSLESEVASLRTGLEAQSGALDEVRGSLRDMQQDIRALLARAGTLATSEQVAALDTRMRAIEAHNAEMKPHVDTIPTLHARVRDMPSREEVEALKGEVSKLREELARKVDAGAVDGRLKPLEESRSHLSLVLGLVRWVGPSGLAALVTWLYFWLKSRGGP